VGGWELAITSGCVDVETALLVLLACRHQLAPPGAKRRAASVRRTVWRITEKIIRTLPLLSHMHIQMEGSCNFRFRVRSFMCLVLDCKG